MRRIMWVGIVVSLGLGSGLSAAAGTDGCRVFLLRRSENLAALERLDLEAGASRTLALGGGSEWITFVLPLGPGKAADLVQEAAGTSQLGLLCDAAGLHASIKTSAGASRALPPVTLTELESYDLRVNVKTGKGEGKVFTVAGGRRIAEAAGPVLDLFGGRVPMQAGDVAITLETALAARPTPLAGKAPLVFDGEHHFVHGRLKGGAEGWFVVDLAAGRTVVLERALPRGVGAEALSAIEYSASGARQLGAEMLGLGGAVDSFVGTAHLPRLSVGSLAFEDADVNVLRSLPEIGGREILGILGLDLLERGTSVRLTYTAEGELTFGGAPSTAGKSIPFTSADRHLFLAGGVGETVLTFVLDSGAKVSLLSPSLRDRLGLAQDPQRSVEVRGLSASPIRAPRAEVAALRLGGEQFPSVAFHVAPLPVLDRWGLTDRGAILGNDFLERFSAIEVDFDRGEVRFVPR